MSIDSTWTELTDEMRDLALLGGAAASLAWDQQTYMPAGSGNLRGEQMAVISKLLHERSTSERVGGWLQTLSDAELDPARARAVTLLRRDYDRSVRVPSSLVERAARARAAGFGAWVKARSESDFASFSPHLVDLLAISRETAAAMDPDGHPLQVHMEGYDPGVKIADLKTMFSRLQAGLTELIRATDGSPEPSAVGGSWPIGAQRELHGEVAAALGYDLAHGRIDDAQHPFTISLGHGDTRITTHLHEGDLLAGLGGTIHEAGHAMYEQGLPTERLGTGLDVAASYGLHESQSRFWENTVGRSRAFFTWLKPRLDTGFPGHGTSAEALYAAANRIRPGFIRVHADEVTYNLHIVVRFELELAMFEGRLDVADLPEAWNAKYADYLGITPSNDAEGCLQDVHWSSGAFAYFQSYTLGNLYAASFGATLRQEMPDFDDRIAAGDFAPILAWLRDRIHRHGRELDGADRVKAVVGERDSVEDLLAYLWGRHGALYGLTRPGR